MQPAPRGDACRKSMPVAIAQMNGMNVNGGEMGRRGVVRARNDDDDDDDEVQEQPPPCPLSGALARACGYEPGGLALPPEVTFVNETANALAPSLEDMGAVMDVMREAQLYSGWHANRQRLWNERDVRKARRRARRAEADRDQNVAVLRQRQRVPCIAELTDAEYAGFVHQLAGTLEATVPKMIREVDGLLPHGAREMIELVVGCHRKQTFAPATRFIERRCKQMCTVTVNGDFQRGKSTLEALYGVINHAINVSPVVADKCATLLVTQLRAWAMALESTCKVKTAAAVEAAAAEGERDARDDDDDDAEMLVLDRLVEEGGGGVDVADLGALPIARKTGQRGRDDVRECFRQGGMVVAFRTGAQFEDHIKLFAEINDSRGPDEKAYVLILVLDEADKFFGDTTAQHSQKLQWILGLNSRAQPNVPIMLACVSATNAGPSYWLFRRMHAMNEQRRLALEYTDQVSFKPPAAGTYRYETVPFLPAGEVVSVPRPDTEYTTPQITELWRACMAAPASLLVDTSCVRVNIGVEHNMIDHVDEIEAQIPVAERRQMAVLYVHGGHTTHQGMLGIQVIGEEHTPWADCGIVKLKQAHWDLSQEEAAHADSLDADGGDPRDVANARAMATALERAGDDLDVNDVTGCIEVHTLTELAWAVKRKALRLGHYTEKQIVGMLDEPPGSFDRDQGCGRSNWSTKNLSLLIFIVRKFIGADVPMAVVGGQMIKRCMSIVAVDVFRPPISVEIDGAQFDGAYVGQPKCLALVTHHVHTRIPNSADGAQQVRRNASTLTNFDVAHPHLLNNGRVWEIVIQDLSEATDGFCAWNAMGEWQLPLAQRKAKMDSIYRDTTSGNRQYTVALFRARLGEQQREWFDSLKREVEAADGIGDSISDAASLFALGCALATHVSLPEATRVLLQRHRNPLFQVRSGAPERDLANIHANLCTIVEGRVPLAFRHALNTRRGRRGGGAGPLGGVPLMAAQWLAENNCREDEDGNAPPDAPEAWTVFWALRAAHPELVGQPGYKELSLTTNHGCGLGFGLNTLVKRDMVYKADVQRVRPDPEPGHGIAANPSNARARKIQVFWLRRNALLVPQAQ